MEDITQRGNMPLKGGEDFIKRSDVKKARCLITWDFLQKHYDYEIPFHHHGEELTNVYYRAISERNMAMVMTKPFMKNNLTLPAKSMPMSWGLSTNAWKICTTKRAKSKAWIISRWQRSIRFYPLS